MSKRNLTLLIIIILIAVGAVGSYFYFISSKSTTPGGVSRDTGTNFFSNIFPSSTPKTPAPTGEQPTNTASTDDTPLTITPIKTDDGKLKKISSFPIAGYGLFDKERYLDVPKVTPIVEAPVPVAPVIETKTKSKKTAKKPAPAPVAPTTEFVTSIRYVEKSTGNVYQTFADKLKEQKFTTTLIPIVHDAFFGTNGENVIMRYLKIDGSTIATFVGALDKEILGADSASSVEIKGSFLPENITDISVSGEGTKIFYLFNTKDGSVGTVSSPLGEKKTQVFSSAYTEWISQFPNANMVTLTTRPSASVPGYMYSVNPATGNFSKIFGGINGLTTLTSPDGKLVLYGGNNLSLSIYNIATKKVSSLGVRTLPEKCTWSISSDTIYCAAPKLAPEGEFPDTWYQGEVSFSDDLWKIDVASNVAGIIMNPSDSINGEDIDAINLETKDGFLFFMNKKDSSLWELNIK